MEMSKCNYCTLQRIKANAMKNDKIVTVKGGNVYVHPFGAVNPTEPASPDNGNKYWVAWLMSIPDHCCC